MPICPHCNEEKNNRGFTVHKMHCSDNPKNHEDFEEPQNEDSKYDCGVCGKKFNDLYKYCPHCGVEFG